MRDTSTEFAELIISPNLLPIPAVIMLIVAGRGFIFWCFNILSIPVVLAYARNILYGGKQTDSGDDRDFQYARSHAHGNNNILEVIIIPCNKHCTHDNFFFVISNLVVMFIFLDGV